MNRFGSQKLVGCILFFLLVFTGCNPTATISPIPTFTKLAPSSPTAQTTPTAPLPTSTISSQTTYTLQHPDLQQLISLISDMRAVAYQNRIEDDWLTKVAEKDAFSVDRFVATDLGQYYAENIPNASQYVDNLPDDWSNLFDLPYLSIEEILFNHSIVDYFNEKHIGFSDHVEKSVSSLRTKAHLLDIEKAPDVERNWLIKVDLDHSGVGLWLALAEDKNGRYRKIPNELGSYLTFFDQETNLKIRVDINNDQKNDIIVEWSYYIGGSYYKKIELYVSNQQKIDYLDSISVPSVMAYFGDDKLGQYELGDHNHDGLQDILLIAPKVEVFDCLWERTTIIQFNGTKRTDQPLVDKIPDQPECLLAKMLQSDQPEEMVALLKSARANLKQDASSDLRTWIQVRLAMLYYGQGKDQQALQELDAIAEFPVHGKGGFQKAVQDAYRQAGRAPLRVCEILNATAIHLQKFDGNFASDIDLDLANLGGYLDTTHLPAPKVVCPYLDVINSRLKGGIPDQNSSPAKAFADLGLSLSPLYQANLDADADPEWIGLLGKDAPEIVFVDRVGGIWKITHDYGQYFGDGDLISNLQVKPLDITGDGRPEVVVSFAYTARYQDKCDEGKHYFSLEILNTDNADYDRLVDKSFECAVQSPFDTLSTQEMIDLYTATKNVDSNGVIYPTWAKVRGKVWDLKTILDDVSEIEDLVFENEQPAQAQAEIKAMLTSLPENDNAADILREHLQYLSGYSYELQGDQEKALEIYLNLIRSNPQSLWSKLAQSRLSIK